MQNKTVLEITYALVIPKNIAKKNVKCQMCFLKTYVRWFSKAGKKS